MQLKKGEEVEAPAEGSEFAATFGIRLKGEKKKERKETDPESGRIKRAPHRLNATLRFSSRCHFPGLPQRAASPTTAVHHFTPQLAPKKSEEK